MVAAAVVIVVIDGRECDWHVVVAVVAVAGITVTRSRHSFRRVVRWPSMGLSCVNIRLTLLGETVCNEYALPDGWETVHECALDWSTKSSRP